MIRSLLKWALIIFVALVIWGTIMGKFRSIYIWMEP